MGLAPAAELSRNTFLVRKFHGARSYYWSNVRRKLVNRIRKLKTKISQGMIVENNFVGRFGCASEREWSLAVLRCEMTSERKWYK